MSAGVSQLVINDVSRSHAGQLTCSAHNDAGSASNDFAVVVHCRQRLTLLTYSPEQALSILLLTDFT